MAVSGEFIWAKIFCLWIGSDARDIGSGSGSFYASGTSLSSTRIVAYWHKLAVELGDDDDAVYSLRTILDARETVFGRGLDCSWALMGCCWVGFGLLRSR